MGRNAGGNVYASLGKKEVAISSTGEELTSEEKAHMLYTQESLSSLEHREVTLQLQKAISRYEVVMGIRERKIRVAELPNGYFGATLVNEDGSYGVYLNKKFFNRHRNEVEGDYKKQYTTGYKNKTNKPIQHTITHELAHATWNSGYSKPKYIGAGNEIRSLYGKWKKDTNKSGYGTYATKNVNEFWAEVIAKGIHGKSDHYTRKAIYIAKKYKL